VCHTKNPRQRRAQQLNKSFDHFVPLDEVHAEGEWSRRTDQRQGRISLAKPFNQVYSSFHFS
jgi:hypothetical protein